MKKPSHFKIFCSYYKNYKGLFTLDLGAAFIMSIITLFYPILTRKIFEDYIPINDTVSILVCCGILLGVYVIRMFLRFFVDYKGHELGIKMQADMRRDLFMKYEQLPFSYYDEHEVGELMSRLTNDLQDISELAHHGPENIFISAVMILGTFIYLLTINWILAVLIFVCVPILFFVAVLTRQKQLKAFAKTKRDLGVMNAQLSSSLTGIRVTKAFDNERKELEHFNEANAMYTESRKYSYKYMSFFHSSTNFIIDLFNVVCIVCGAIIVVKTNIFTIPDYLAFAVSISLFTKPIITLVEFVEQLQDGTAGFKRFMEIMDIDINPERPDALDNVELKGNIKFDDVTFKYQTSDEIIQNMSFDIKSGEKIALVGESGGGKTTICHLIPHFYDVSSGHIYFDNIDIDDIKKEALRKNIGIVQQDIFLFSGTIKANIQYGKLDASDEDIINAAKKAKIYDFIMSLPHGFDSVVGERGVKLSGGQKQRISIARIFLKNPSILILDEATSALDNTTEIEIQKSLNELAKGRTSIIVAHRLSTIKNADRIFVIEKGKIVESGNHKFLMETNGIYAKLYNEQFKLS